MNILLGIYEHEKNEELRIKKQYDIWSIMKLKNMINNESFISIRKYPKLALEIMIKHNSVTKYRYPFLFSSLALIRYKGGILLRRGIINISNQEEERKFEDELTKIIVETIDKQIYANPTFKKIRLYCFVPMHMPPQRYLKIDRDLYIMCGWKNGKVKYKLRSYRINDNCFNFFLMSSEENEPIRILLNMAMEIAHHIECSENCVIEDTQELVSSHVLCSLVKILLDSKYRTVEGFLSLIIDQWINFGYIFSKSKPKIYDAPEIFVLPYRIFHLCVMYLVFAQPEKFQYDKEFLMKVELALLDDKTEYDDTFYLDPFQELYLNLRTYKIEVYDYFSNLYSLFFRNAHLDKSNTIIQTEIFKTNVYKKFWKKFFDISNFIDPPGNYYKRIPEK